MPIRLIIVLTVIAAQMSGAQQASPTAPPKSTRHHITLLPVVDTGGHIVEIDKRAFATTDGLTRYIESLPAGDIVSWFRFSDPSSSNPFSDAPAAIRAVCEKKHIKFHLYLE